MVSLVGRDALGRSLAPDGKDADPQECLWHFKRSRTPPAGDQRPSKGAKALRARLPEAIYESGRSTVAVRVPDEPAARFPALVAAAEAILEVATAP